MTTLDTSVAYRVRGYGCAFRAVRHPERTNDAEPFLICEEKDHDHDGECYAIDDEPYTYEDTDRVIVVMIGDDREHEVDREDLTPLPADDYCAECGQIGCTHDGIVRPSGRWDRE